MLGDTPTDQSKQSSEAKQSFAAVQQEILSAFQGKIQPVQVPITYRLGILLVAVMMVILPLVYIAIIRLAGYGVYYHAMNHAEMLQAGRGRTKAMILLVYPALMIIGADFGPVYVKISSLASRKAEEETITFARQGTNHFTFVERIC